MHCQRTKIRYHWGMEIKLLGHPLSNFCNKVKIALLYKGIPFEEVKAGPSQEEEYKQKSPAGLIPALEVDGEFLSESQAILEFLEDAFPNTPKLLPSDPFSAAKIRQAIHIIEERIDRPARRLYTRFVAGTEIPESEKEIALEELEKGLDAIQRIAVLDPYFMGKNFTMADCTALATFPIVTAHLELLAPQNPISKWDKLKGYLEHGLKEDAVAAVDKGRAAVILALQRRKGISQG